MNAEYEQRLTELQQTLSKIQQAYYTKKLRAVIVLEGVDASGKGGLIRRLAWSMDPRGFKVWPISSPSEEERAQHYLQRFWNKLPSRGSISVFDRSWYGRVLVERVEKLIEPPIWKKAFREINEFERTLIEDGVRLVKIFLKISKREQAARFLERLENPDKRWKLTFEDFRNRDHWTSYEKAAREMILRTSSKSAQWHVVKNDDKKHARLDAMELMVKELSKGLSLRPPPLSSSLKKLIHSLKNSDS